MRADRDAYCILSQKTGAAPWQLNGFSIEMDPRSRLADNSHPDAPCLPIPAPQLYAYQLPQMTSRDPQRFQNSMAATAEVAVRPEISRVGYLQRLPDDPLVADSPIRQLAHFSPLQPPPTERLPPEPSPAEGVGTLALDSSANQLAERQSANRGEDDQIEQSGKLRVVRLKESVWDSIPDRCLKRMFEFESIRSEFSRSYADEVPEGRMDASPRATLEDLVELALLNSREYQTQKERLYEAALQLSLERYAYQLKFLPTGNGTEANWSHLREAGVTANTLAIPSAVGVDKVLATGGDFLARFANNVLLTFNGVDGFTADVGSEIFVEFSQRLLQRDVIFERLTTAERNVVYSARDYARFRKTFFRDIASSYYQLLLTYRGIEIDALDYFSNQRGFDQSQAEERAGRLPRFQVDQFEQNALASRSRLIRSCNSLERGLDQLKLTLGIPPETPINLDLLELEQITLGDQSAVAGELIKRAEKKIRLESSESMPDQNLLVSAATNLTRRILDLLRLQPELSEDFGTSKVDDLLDKLEVREARIVVERNRRTLNNELIKERADPLNVLQQRIELIRALLVLGEQQIQSGQSATDYSELEALANDFEAIRTGWAAIQKDLSQIPRLVEQSETLLKKTEALVDDGDGDPQAQSREVNLAMGLANQVMRLRDLGLSEVKISVDDAMVTALVNRFELMNERGITADAWRQVKLAADDLRSALNLRASQSIKTRSDVNRVFDFTLDESETQLGVSFDAPLNRRAQRNTYRSALIGYQQARRNLMRAEDQIKVDVRNNLRDLELDREQYVIAVASAALANERVYSTRLQLQLGLGNVTARDFLEAQQAYTASLSTVASEHIGYILDRIELFLNLELLQVDEFGFWPQLYDEESQPDVRYAPPPNSGPAYGRLPRRVKYSDWVRCLERIPFGSVRVFGADNPPTGTAGVQGDIPGSLDGALQSAQPLTLEE